MRKILLGFMIVILLFLSACKPGSGETPFDIPENYLPAIYGADDLEIEVGTEFDPMEGITAYDFEDGDLVDITCTGEVDTETPGVYQLSYRVTDSKGETATADRFITVTTIEIVYPTGFYNYKFADTETRHTFMAAAEKYLMNNMAGGVPLFASGSFKIYSMRLQLPVDEYVTVMGYGTDFGTLTEDDSTILMPDGNPGEVGEYTYRDVISHNVDHYNHWLYDTSIQRTVMAKFQSALYGYRFNDDKTGYEIKPLMARSKPIPQEFTYSEHGKLVSKKWVIEIKDDLEWKFHPDTNANFLSTNPDPLITSLDFVQTYKLALDEQWFRAVSGGGDFTSSSQAIEGVQDYIDGTGDWEDVGIKASGNTIEFEFVNDMSEWNVMYWLSSFEMSPINLELYNYLGMGDPAGPNTYGQYPETTAYHGEFYLDSVVEDEYILLKANDKYSFDKENNYTAYHYEVISDASEIFTMFTEGKLEASGMPSAEVSGYVSHPRIKRIPGATVYRLMINGFKTEEAQRERFPEGTWIPEPILGELDFKMAMFHAVDRDYLATDLLQVRVPTMYYFSNAYLIDAELGVAYRKTEHGQSVGEGLYPETHGYNETEAIKRFNDAIDKLVSEGYYTGGTESDPIIITLQLNNYASSPSWDIACGYLKEQYERLFVSDEHHIKVEIDIHEMSFPALYYEYMLPGEFDLSVGGISGSTLDAASFLDTYSSDNRSGFTTNFGIDTSTADIPVERTNEFGKPYIEMWSFDAISSVLVGEIFIYNGTEAEVPVAKNIEVTPTSFSFEVENMNNEYLKDLTFTLRYYDLSNDQYHDLEDYIDIPIDSDVVTIENLTPFYYGIDEFGDIIYQGDYLVELNFLFRENDREGSNSSPWFEMAEVIDYEESVDGDDYSFSILINEEDYLRTVSTITLYEREDTSSDAFVVSSLNVTETYITNFTTTTLIIGVEATSITKNYLLKIVFDDDTIAYIQFN